MSRRGPTVTSGRGGWPLVLCVVLGSTSIGCATAGGSWATEVGEGPMATGDELFAAGEYDAAIAAYGHELRTSRDAGEQARLRLFRALSSLAEGDARGEEEALADLRAVENDHAGTLWGRVARVLVLELTRRDALREAIMQAGADLERSEHQVRLLQSRLLTAQALTEEQARSLATVEEERKSLRRKLDEMTEQAEARQARILDLQRELEALKQIDLGRDP